MSQYLSLIAIIGLKALDNIANNKIVDACWLNENRQEIDKAKISRGQVELMVVLLVEKLIKKVRIN
jgi:hypothetical protein